MRPVTVSVTGIGVSTPVPLDTYISPVSVGFGASVSGTATYTVEHTFDDVFAANYDPNFGTWYAHPTVVSKPGDAYGSYDLPITAIRLVVLSGTGTVVLKSIQAGLVGA